MISFWSETLGSLLSLSDSLSKMLRMRTLESARWWKRLLAIVYDTLILAGLLMVVGFAVLSTSSFAINSRMGLMTAIIIFIALVGVFLMLPPLLMKIEEKAIHASSHDGTVDRAAAA